ncbi:hypothetical protein SH661x_001453 [Planctomicrobium sp. SH661]|uniref:hypothetical protein n=1 Tax=Planctomicrobium sp. SH661 TaxID=3448124 RepID=UPI003F5C9ECD
MSTSGIMIMIVLILCLELIQRPEISAHASPPVSEPGVPQSTISELQEEIRLLERRIVDANSLIQSASQLTAAELDEQIQNLQTVNQLLSAKKDDLQTKLTAIEQGEPADDLRRKQLEELRRRFLAAQQEAARLKHELQVEIHEDRSIFSLPRGDRRSGWIVELSASAIQVAPIGRAEKPTRFVPSRSGFLQTKTPQQAFLDWTKQAESQAYFFLFVRPDGVEAFEEISQVFEKNNVSFGFDLADSEQQLLHPVRGAGE